MALKEDVPDGHLVPDGSEAPSLFGRIIFYYIGSVISVARKAGRLEVPDIPQHVRLYTSELATQFGDALHKRLQRPKKEPKVRKVKKGEEPRPPAGPIGASDLAWSLLAGRKFVFLLTAVGYAISTGSQLAGPLLLKEIVRGLSCRRAATALPQGAAGLGCSSETTLYMCGPCLSICIIVPCCVQYCYTFLRLSLVVRLCYHSRVSDAWRCKPSALAHQ